jgi:hypothetical protein
MLVLEPRVKLKTPKYDDDDDDDNNNKNSTT